MFIYFRTKAKDGFEVIYITDISKGGEKPKVEIWTYKTLKSNMKEGKASLVRFNFLDIQVCARDIRIIGVVKYNNNSYVNIFYAAIACF